MQIVYIMQIKKVYEFDYKVLNQYISYVNSKLLVTVYKYLIVKNRPIHIKGYIRKTVLSTCYSYSLF